MKSKGLGDTIEKVIKVVYPKMAPCDSCRKRKEKLNKLASYGKAQGNRNT